MAHVGHSAKRACGNAIPLKTVVHKVLRRSRFRVKYFMALCYIEVLRQKVPELADQEKNGVTVSAGSISAGVLLRSPVRLQWSCGSTSVRSFFNIIIAQSDIELGAAARCAPGLLTP